MFVHEVQNASYGEQTRVWKWIAAEFLNIKQPKVSETMPASANKKHWV